MCVWHVHVVFMFMCMWHVHVCVHACVCARGGTLACDGEACACEGRARACEGRARVREKGEGARVRGECETEALLSATNWRDQMRRDVECIMHRST